VTAPPKPLADRGLQAERTALAWERTSISLVVLAVLLARVAAIERWWPVAAAGVALTAAGAAVLVWAGSHHDDLHGPLRRGEQVVHPLAARVTGMVAVTGCGLSLAVGVAIAVTG
jgi:uncharacterized membrane protein YidH (DUF202 family)